VEPFEQFQSSTSTKLWNEENACSEKFVLAQFDTRGLTRRGGPRGSADQASIQPI
jgi:hypothetical protein